MVSPPFDIADLLLVVTKPVLSSRIMLPRADWTKELLRFPSREVKAVWAKSKVYLQSHLKNVSISDHIIFVGQIEVASCENRSFNLQHDVVEFGLIEIELELRRKEPAVRKPVGLGKAAVYGWGLDPVVIDPIGGQICTHTKDRS